MKIEKVTEEKRIFDDFFKIDEAHLKYERFDGTMSEPVRHLNFNRGDSVAAVILNIETNQVILVNQFKYPTLQKDDGWIVETVAGILEDGEDPQEAIRREILEEVGYKVNKLEFISKFYVSPGGTSERIYLYYAEVNNKGKIAGGGGLAGEHEDIQVVEIPLAKAWEDIKNAQFIDAKTIIGLMWLQNKLGKEK